MSQRDERVRKMPEKGKRDVAYRLLRKELAAEIQLPSFEEWRSDDRADLALLIATGRYTCVASANVISV